MTQLLRARLNADQAAVPLVAVPLDIVRAVKVESLAQELATYGALGQSKRPRLRKALLGEDDHIPDIVVVRVLQQEADVHNLARAGPAAQARARDTDVVPDESVGAGEIRADVGHPVVVNGAGGRIDHNQPDRVDSALLALKVGGRRVESEILESQVVHIMVSPHLSRASNIMPAPSERCRSEGTREVSTENRRRCSLG